MRQHLEDAIEQLHDQLATAEDLSPEEADEIRRAIVEISETLDKQDVSSAGLAERLQEQTASFQQSHPVLTRTVGRIADMLAQMGI